MLALSFLLLIRCEPHRGRSRLSHSERQYVFRDRVLAVCPNAQLENAIPKTCGAGATKPTLAEGNQSHQSAALNL